jgi:hypothetical protein
MKSLNLSRRAVFIAVASIVATAAGALAAAYSYKCPKCGLIQTYAQPKPGVKCPNDGWIMTPN